MNPYIYKAKCLNVVDGDTIDCVIDLGFKMTTTQRVRLINIDAPEEGSPGYDAATEYLVKQLLSQHIYVQTSKDDDFGRYLAKVFIYSGMVDNEKTYLCLNDMLIQEGLAVPYQG